MNGCLPTVEARGLPRCPKPNSPDFKGTISHNKDSVRPAGWNSKKQKRNAALRHTQKVRGDLPPLSSEQPPQIQSPGQQGHAARVTVESPRAAVHPAQGEQGCWHCVTHFERVSHGLQR